MIETAASVPTPTSEDWSWGPMDRGLGGYGGTCVVGPITFTVSARQRLSSWELSGAAELADVQVASQSWETDSLRCTPEGLIAEITERDLLRQLVAAARRRVALAAELLEKFDSPLG